MLTLTADKLIQISAMARRRPVYPLSEIEEQIGYNTESLNYPADAAERFYADLSPVPSSAYEKAQKEVEERAKRSLVACKPVQGNFAPTIEIPHVGSPASTRAHLKYLTSSQTITRDGSTLTFTCRSQVGCYNFTADIHFDFGLELPLLLTRDEATLTISVSEVSTLPGRLDYTKAKHS